MYKQIIILTAILFYFLPQAYTQLPVCNGTKIIYLHSGSLIYNLDLSQPNPVPVLNTITTPPGASGLLVSKNLNAASPANTFYTVFNGLFYYYDGTNWVNTYHIAGPGINMGGGGGYIYNYSVNGEIWRYDGTSNSSLLLSVPTTGSVADISVDCSGNFYMLFNNTPQSLTKYRPDGSIMQVYTLTGAPLFTGAGGLAVFGNDVYYDDLSGSPASIPLLHGTISGNSVNFVSSGIIINSSDDFASCPSIMVNPVPVVVRICNSQLPYWWNGQLYTTAGTYMVTITNPNGCDSTVSLQLEIDAFLRGDTARVNTCTNQLPYFWNGQNYFTAGFYTDTITISNGCDSIATLHLLIHPVDSTSVDTTICSSQFPFNWNGQQYSSGGNYFVTLTGSNGCDSVVKLRLVVLPSPPMPTVISGLQYCQFENIPALSAVGSGPLSWYASATGGTGSATAPVPVSTTPGISSYYVSQRIGTCESPRAVITVNVLSSPQLGPDKPVTICHESSVNLIGLYNVPGATGNWYFNQVPISNPASVSQPGNYLYIATDPSGCADTGVVNLVVQPVVNAFAGNDDSAVYNSPYQLLGTGGVVYEWLPGVPVLNDPTLSNPIARLTESTLFTLIVRDAVGCKGFDTVFIKVVPAGDIYVPSAFSPNGDGLNDLLKPLGSAIAELDHFRVYNRYGQVIFETRDLNKGWDGTYKGAKQPTANYLWLLKALDRKNNIRTLKGNTLLIR